MTQINTSVVSLLETRVLAAMAIGILVTGCNRAPLQTFRTTVVCRSSTVGNDNCPAAARQAAFESWIREGSFVAGSTFEVWQPEPNGIGARRVISICTPARWHGSAAAQRAAFIRRARVRVTTPTEQIATNATYSSACDTSDRATSLPEYLVEIGDNGHTVTRNVPAHDTPAAHVSVVCDTSSSMRAAPTCTAKRVAELYDRWSASTEALVPGATFTVHRVGRARDTARRMFESIVADSRPAERLVALTAKREVLLREFSADEPKTAGSAIAEAISVASQELQEKRGVKTLTILSDLRQVSGSWQFERRPVPAPLFAEQLRKQSLLSDLSGVDVLVCTHQSRSPGAAPYTATNATTSELAWDDAFKKMHAAHFRILTDCGGQLVTAEPTSGSNSTIVLTNQT